MKLIWQGLYPTSAQNAILDLLLLSFIIINIYYY